MHYYFDKHQGNLQFEEVEEDQLQISNPEVVSNIASLLATTPDAVEKALCFRVVGNKLGSVEKMHTVDQAVYGRDAFAKAIYERLFTWIVGRINAQLEVKVVTPGDNSVIGVLDIYGFEIFDNNRYVSFDVSTLLAVIKDRCNSCRLIMGL